MSDVTFRNSMANNKVRSLYTTQAEILDWIDCSGVVGFVRMTITLQNIKILRRYFF